jgi:sulfoxide reductase heme-binding subunit YedZ
MSGAAATLAWAPWTDKKGRLHPLRAVVFGLLLVPGAWLALREALGMLGPRALNELIHGAGYWAVWLLLASLTITPAAAISGNRNLVVIRRMVGNGALAYALIHLTLYITDQKWKLGTVASEIALRFYLTIGFVALCGLVALGITSTDGWARRLGKRWKRLHRIVYGIGALGLIHYLLQVKADVSVPLLWAGIFYWLMLWRVLPAGRDRGPVALTGLTLAAAVLTVATEWGWYRFGTHIDPMRVLRAELDLSFGLHPAGQVLALGLLAVLAQQLQVLSQGRAGQGVWFWIGLYAAGAWAPDLAAFVFGLDTQDIGEGLSWLWQDLAWAALLGALGLIRVRAAGPVQPSLVDAIALACIAERIVLYSSGLLGVEVGLAAGLAALWAVLAWQSWRRSKLPALTLMPLGLLLAWGIVGPTSS